VKRSVNMRNNEICVYENVMVVNDMCIYEEEMIWRPNEIMRNKENNRKSTNMCVYDIIKYNM